MGFVIRINDQDSGHGCYPPRPSQIGSPDVIVNGQAVERKTDTLQPHGCAICAKHQGTHNGDHNVFANGLAIQIVSDPMNGCASVCDEHSPDVTVD